jgi:hypothetical protein
MIAALVEGAARTREFSVTVPANSTGVVGDGGGGGVGRTGCCGDGDATGRVGNAYALPWVVEKGMR